MNDFINPYERETWPDNVACRVLPTGEFWLAHIDQATPSLVLSVMIEHNGHCMMTWNDPDSILPLTGGLVVALCHKANIDPHPASVLTQLWQLNWALEQCQSIINDHGGWCDCASEVCGRAHDPTLENLMQPRIAVAAGHMVSALNSWASRHEQTRPAQEFFDQSLNFALAETPMSWMESNSDTHER